VIRDWAYELHRTRSRDEMSRYVVETAPAMFGARAAAVSMYYPELQSPAFVGGSREDLDEYDRRWRADDPVADAMRAAQTVVHDGELFDLAAWRRQPMFDLAARMDLHVYCLVPILGPKGVEGNVTLLRRRDRFTATEVRNLAAVAANLSVAHARLSAHGNGALQVDHARLARLTAQERRVATLVARGLQNKEVAQHLGTSPLTVRNQLASIFAKTGIASRGQLVLWAARSGLDTEP